MTTGSIIAGFSVSTVGFSFFVYGKKQGRLPQLLVSVEVKVMRSTLFRLCPELLLLCPHWTILYAVFLLSGKGIPPRQL